MQSESSFHVYALKHNAASMFPFSHPTTPFLSYTKPQASSIHSPPSNSEPEQFRFAYVIASSEQNSAAYHHHHHHHFITVIHEELTGCNLKI
jgi:hypothetical protein